MELGTIPIYLNKIRKSASRWIFAVALPAVINAFSNIFVRSHFGILHFSTTWAFALQFYHITFSILGRDENYREDTNTNSIMMFLILFTLLTQIFTLKRFYNEGCKLTHLLGSMIVQAFAIITYFSTIYFNSGIINNDNIIKHDWSAAMYFSIVTWTTLGYGDFQPVETVRLYAAWEALLGYMYLGLIVGLMVSVSGMRQNSK